MKNRILVFLTLVIALGAQGQQRLSAEEYRQLVTTYSPRIKMSQEQSVASDERYKAARTGYLPSLSLAANGSYTVGNQISFGEMTLKDYSYNSNLTLQQKVYAGGSVRNQTRVAKVEQDISQLGEKSVLQNVLYQADLYYAALVAAREQVNLMEEYVKIVRNLYDIVDVRFKDGYVSKTDLLMVETRLSEAMVQHISARRLYFNALQQVNTLLGVEPTTEYILDGLSLPDIKKYVEPDVDALANRPDYQIAGKQVELSAANVRLTRSKYNPQLIVGIQGIYGTPSLNFTGIPVGYGAAFAQLSVPILMWGERLHSVRAVKASERSAMFAESEKRDQIQGEVSRALTDMRENTALAKVSDRNQQAASDNLELNTFSYAEGKLPILDVLQSQLAWIQSYTNMLNSTYNLMVSVIDYRKAIGRLE